MRGLALALLLVSWGTALAGTSRQEAERRGLGRLGDGTAVVVLLRPTQIVEVLRRLGIAQQADVADLQARAGVNILDPALLAATGIDPAGTAVIGLLELPRQAGKQAAAPRYFHHRAVVALADVERFKLFLAGIGSDAKGALQPVAAATPLGKLGVLARAELPSGGFALLRLDGKSAIVDAVTPSWVEAAVKLPTALDVARRPLSPASGGLAARLDDRSHDGARRLLVSDAAVALFVDGRAIAPLSAALLDLPRLWKGLPPEADPLQRKARQQELVACRALFAGPAPFDDAALAVVPTSDGTDLHVAWAGPGVVVATADDGALNAEAIAPTALGTVSVKLASLAPLRALRREGALAGLSQLDAARKSCRAIAAAELAVRRWPLVIGLMIDHAGQSRTTGLLAPLVKDLLDKLRNVDVLVRDLAEGKERWAVAVTFDGAARPPLALFFGSGGDGDTAAVPGRPVTVYKSQLVPGSAAGLEDLPGGRLLLVQADSRETLQWAYTASATGRGRPTRPTVAQLRFNAPVAVRASRTPVGPYLVELASRVGVVDGDVTSEAGLLELTLRTNLRAPPPPATAPATKAAP